MQKNELFQLRIDDLGSNGEGIGHADGMAVFVENALPGELITVKAVKAKKNYAFGKLMEIKEPSPYRVKPLCPSCGQCGGCQLQHLRYDAQLRYKKKRVVDCLERIGGFKNCEVADVIGMGEPFGYRNKAQLPVGGTAGDVKVGFYAERSHRIVAMERCNINGPYVSEIAAAVKSYMERCGITPYAHEDTARGGRAAACAVRHLVIRKGFATGEIMVCLVITDRRLPRTEELIKSLSAVEGVKSIALNLNAGDTNVIFGKHTRVIWGSETIADYIRGLRFEISPVSFFQVNPAQTAVLYEKALELARPGADSDVIDAYCGIGTMSLLFAQRARKVFGVEIVAEAVADARRNAVVNGIENAEFITGDSCEVIEKLIAENKARPHIVVLDPPRKGCDAKLLDALIRARPERLVYVSCDPATLARDMRVLCGNGYVAERVQPVDMFPMTSHVENVVLMSAVK